MELQFLWHFCPSRQAYALVHKYHSFPLCGGLSIDNKNGFSNRKETMSNVSHRSRMGVIHSASFKSRASEAFPEPLQVLASTEALANYSVADSLEEGLCASTLPDLSESIYRVALTTSNNVDSDFSDINVGILLCMIGENGNSIIHRIPAISSAPQALSEDTAKTVQRTFNHLRFQRGSVDIVIFRGPDIGQLAAVWIGPESGSWRLGGLNVMVIPPSQSVGNPVDNLENLNSRNLRLYYSFRTNDVLLGEDGDSAAELRPFKMQELSGNDIWMRPLNPSAFATMETTQVVSGMQQESLKEYKDLKFSLLLYDAVLVACGTSIAAIAGSQEISNGFAIGGVLGFMYLLLLQRAVDRLSESSSFGTEGYPGPKNNESSLEDDHIHRESKVEQQGQNMDMKNSTLSINNQFQLKNERFQDKIAGFRGPLTNLSWTITILFLASRYAPGNVAILLKPEELLSGAAGFLTCKLAAVIAAFRTIPADWKDHKK